MDPRDAHLTDPHILPLMTLVVRMREQGLSVPNFDPNDGGTGARALFLSETPGPKAVGTGYVSQDNPDPSARNKKMALDQAGFARSQVLLWNVVPYCLSTTDQNANATLSQIKDAIRDTQDVIDRLPELKVVVYCGLEAQKAKRYIRLRSGVHALRTFHTGGQSFNHAHLREDIFATYRTAFELAVR